MQGPKGSLLSSLNALICFGRYQKMSKANQHMPFGTFRGNQQKACARRSPSIPRPHGPPRGVGPGRSDRTAPFRFRLAVVGLLLLVVFVICFFGLCAWAAWSLPSWSARRPGLRVMWARSCCRVFVGRGAGARIGPIGDSKHVS